MTVKTKTVTLKISEENERVLLNELKIQNISLNTFTNKVVEEWINFQRHLEESEMIILPKKILQEIIQTHSESQIQVIANKMSEYYTDFLLLKNNGEEEKLEAVLKTIFEKMGFGKIILENDKKYFSCKIVHDFGRKGSILLKNLIEPIILNLYGVLPQIKYNERILLLRCEKELVLNNSQEILNKQFSEKFTVPFHMAVSYSNKEELSQLICNFIQKGIQKNMLNLLIIQKKYEPYYISMFEDYNFTKLDNIKEEIEIIYSDNLFENMSFGESYSPIITALDIASDLAKAKKKSGLNIIGTIAHDLLLNSEEKKCFRIEEGWKRIIPHYSPPIQLLCPHKIPVKKSSGKELELSHSEGFQKFEDGLKIITTEMKKHHT